MIRLYVASEKLVKEEKDICVRLVLPVEENEIWIALQKAETVSYTHLDVYKRQRKRYGYSKNLQ